MYVSPHCLFSGSWLAPAVNVLSIKPRRRGPINNGDLASARIYIYGICIKLNNFFFRSSVCLFSCLIKAVR